MFSCINIQKSIMEHVKLPFGWKAYTLQNCCLSMSSIAEGTFQVFHEFLSSAKSISICRGWYFYSVGRAITSVRKFCFLSFATQKDSLWRHGKLETLRVYGVEIISYRDNHLSVQGSQEKTELELLMSGILVFWKAAAEFCYRSVSC